MASQPDRVSEPGAPATGLDGKNVKVGADSLQGTTPSVRSEDLVVGDYGSDSNHVFSEPKVADYWRGVYEKAQYEGRHRFDPTLTWSADEEKKLRRKVDLRIMIWCWIMFMALDLNRRNINRGPYAMAENLECPV